MSNFSIDPNYTDVAERMQMVRAMFPMASFRPANIDKPYSIEKIGEAYYVVFTAAIYREPTDECPAIGVAWEQVPGATPYTKGSELMNAETSAWGRACIAVGIPSKKIASADEVKARQPLKVVPEPTEAYDPWATTPTNPSEVLDAYHCIHGERMEVTGEKNGKPYYGMGCRKDRNSGEQCSANWFVLNPDGQWVPKS